LEYGNGAYKLSHWSTLLLKSKGDNMAIKLTIVDARIYPLDSNTIWEELYPVLQAFARRLISSFNVPAWRGQEDDIAEDVAQETVKRLVERLQEAEQGTKPSIRSLKAMAIVIAGNYCRDLRRRDSRLLRLTDYTPLKASNTSYGQVNLADHAADNVFQEGLFLLLAHEIVHFPLKQRQALLTDLAGRMAFDTRPTALQKAFLEVGVQMQAYRVPISKNPLERSRYASILNCAYKRLYGLKHVLNLQDIM
jgi:DNA-directed RNA polymerase specialized sigma24 family protein